MQLSEIALKITTLLGFAVEKKKLMDVSDDEWYASKSVKHDQADQSVLSHTDKDICHQIFMDFRQALVYTYSSMGNMG